MMERCPCGAEVRALSRRVVREWRAGHRHTDDGPDSGPDSGPEGAESVTERADRGWSHLDAEVKLPIGFRLI